MPKRSNEFQKLISRINEQLAPVGATVTESAMLAEAGVQPEVLREVDILFECEVAGTKLRIAIECRDHSRKASVEWIDALRGKYANLPVDRVVAVARAGLSKSAIAKAAMHRIDVATLDDAMETDWETEFTRLGLALVDQRLDYIGIRLETDPGLPEGSDPNSLLVFQRDEPLGLLMDVAGRSWPQLVPKAREYLKAELGLRFAVLADFDKPAVLEMSSGESGMQVVDPDDNVYVVREFTYRIQVVHSVTKVPMSRRRFRSAGVHVGVISTGDGQDVTVTMIQKSGDDQVRVFMDPAASKVST